MNNQQRQMARFHARFAQGNLLPIGSASTAASIASPFVAQPRITVYDPSVAAHNAAHQGAHQGGTFVAPLVTQTYKASAPMSDDDKSSRKKKKKKAFSKEKVEKLSNRTSSDDSDSGPCYSDYERTPGTKAGEKGSCRPKRKKRKKEGGDSD